MEDLPLSLLTQQENARPKTGEDLETFGKYAASLHLNGGKTLSEAVVETVKTAGLAPEQVQRVIEFANTSAYLKKFAEAGPQHRVISFDGGPASFADVIRDLNDGGGGSLMDPAHRSSDYSRLPPDVMKLAAANRARLGLEETKLASAFRVQEVPIPFEEPLQEALEMRDKLASLYNEATSELGGLETRNYDLCDLLFHEVKQASLSDIPLGHIVAALSEVSEEPEFMKAAFAMLGPRLLENGVFHDFESFSESLEKTAGVGVVNTDHPMLGIYADFCDTLSKLAATREVSQDLTQQLDAVSNFLQAAQRKTAAAAIPKAWRAATEGAARLSKPVGKAVKELAGETAGKVVGGGVKYAPHIAAGLAAESVYQHAKYHPATRGAVNFVMGRVPYTQQNQMRQYQLANGM